MKKLLKIIKIKYDAFSWVLFNFIYKLEVKFVKIKYKFNLLILNIKYFFKTIFIYFKYFLINHLKLYYKNKLKIFDDCFEVDIYDCDKFTFEEFNEEFENNCILPSDGKIIAVQLNNKFTNIFVLYWSIHLCNNFDYYTISYEKLKKLSKKYNISIYWAGN